MKSIHSISEASGGRSTVQQPEMNPMEARTMEPHTRPRAAMDPGASISPTSHPAMLSRHDEATPRYHRPSTPSTGSVHLLHYATSTTPLQNDTASTVSTQATAATLASSETNPTSYSADTSPSLHQSIFSIKDGSDVSNNRRASRRRTGPLSQQSRERAALIRKLGACPDCRRRRVACHPSHHDMTWEDVVHKFHQSHSPTMLDAAPSTMPLGGSISPLATMREPHAMFTLDAQEMDVDAGPSTSHHHASRLSLSDPRIRTPLPSGPRLEKSLSLPGIESFRNDLQTTANRMLSATNRGRYLDARALLLVWQDDHDAANVHAAMRELADVFEKQYRFAFQIQSIPSTERGLAKDTWRWLSRTLDRFADEDDRREVLKIVYYAGHTFLDENREMCLASSRDAERASIVRWSTLQQPLEQASSDVLVIMDAAFYPCSRILRKQGIMEILGASISEDHLSSLGRCTFTKALAEQLRIRAGRAKPLSVTELHAILLSAYPNLVQDRHPEDETAISFPTPFHMMVSGNSRLPSIFLGPMHQHSPHRGSFSFDNMPQISLNVRLKDENVDVDSWNEWLRLIPETARDVRVDGPFRAQFR
ncbi:hypothetical protein LLEC1_05466 [Akanthomyces lecanii]|uniref:Tyrosine-protein phosphatase non-receptor type 6 n=1 Tax=Cordyceps confragosa TaxID=2714763 RepID=A0A179IGR4_CORDF|nr:hypothetical protein LLEC1_05466 [Akanthomyces lecanii]